MRELSINTAVSDRCAKELTTAAERLRERIHAIRRGKVHDFEWYPYDSLTNVERIERLATGRFDFLLEKARAEGVLDIGCADGDLSFLFESLGCKVTAIDHPVTNHNGMRGVRAMKEHLGSSIEIVETELDEEFLLPGSPRGLTLFLGTLYHLKNPYQAMERLAKHSGYCMFNTRVARFFPDGSPMPKNEPIAYLVDADELNDDESNYWIFSIAGLHRLLRRTRWEVLETFSVGDTKRSDPASRQRDERIFCLLKSHYGLANVELVDGWHEVEQTGWRWTERTFSLRAGADAAHKPERITMRMYLPVEVFRRLGPITLSGAVGGERLRSFSLNDAGEHIYTARFRRPADSPLIAFELDKCIPRGLAEPRELGIVVASVEIE